MKNIIVLAGFSGAGKTTIAKNLVDKTNFGFIEHQRLVHSIANTKGYSRARYWLKDVGTERFVNDSLEEIVKEIKVFSADSKTGVVADVAYGLSMLSILKHEFPEAKILVLEIKAGENIREERIGSRMGGVERPSALHEREFRDGFLKEVGLEEVLEVADFSIENRQGEIENVVERLYNLIRQRTSLS